jgi:transcriptional regulator with GAF, ATPase, and Fis domain
VVLTRVAKVAPTDSTVLLTGETGTGKELIARAIHEGSPRSMRPIVSVNCAATPASLIAAELFGHERGAFTGALQRRPGRFEIAAGGTLFLDEVGELPMETQIALLRVLQEREFERVGGTTTIHADVRVVAATNRDLAAAIAAGTFRSDLYYRLNVFPVEVPPLRERREDIRALIEVFVDRYARRAQKTIRRISDKTVALLEAYAWPGNIRELQNVIERSVIMCESEVFSVDESWHPRDLDRELSPRQPLQLLQFPTSESRAAESSPSSRTLEEIERAAILRALRSANWMVGGTNGAAASLGLKRTTLQSRMRKLGIASPKTRARQPQMLTGSGARCSA